MAHGRVHEGGRLRSRAGGERPPPLGTRGRGGPPTDVHRPVALTGRAGSARSAAGTGTKCPLTCSSGGEGGGGGLVEPPDGLLTAYATGGGLADRPVGGERAGDRLGPAVAAGDEPHRATAIHRLEGEGDAVGWRLGGVVDGDGQRVAGLESSVPGEQRRAVAVGS